MKKYLIAEDGRDEVVGPYRCYFVRDGFYSNDTSEARKFSWIAARIKMHSLRNRFDDLKIIKCEFN